MKIKIKRVSKQALSVILAIMMLVSTMLIGTISVVAADGYTIYVVSNESVTKLVAYDGSNNNDCLLTDTRKTYTNSDKGFNKAHIYVANNVSTNTQYLHLQNGDTKLINNMYGKDNSFNTGDFFTYNGRMCLNDGTSNGTWVDYTPDTGEVGAPTFYFEQYNSGHSYIPMDYNSDTKSYTHDVDFSSNSNFRITNAKEDPNNANYSVTAHNKDTKINFSTGLNGTTYSISQFSDVVLTFPDGITSKACTVEYVPNSTGSLDGVINIKLQNESVATGLAKPKLKCDSYVLPGSEVTVTLDNQKNYYNKAATETDYITSGVLNGLSFSYTVTDSDGNNVEVTPGSCNKFVETDGTTPITTINDKITFTASSDENVTYTIKCTVTATDKTAVDSDEFTVTTTSNNIKSQDRIYAYANALAEGAKPTAPDAWVAAEKVADPQAVYKNKDAVNTYPSLGSTSETNLRIFLPSTASKENVTLYNAFNSEINVNGKSIPANGYATITYTPGTEMTVTGATPTALTIYTSDAQGAVYLNNTGAYPGYYDNGVPKMIEQLYTNKDTGEIGKGMGNTGAISDSKGTRSASVKKVKGRGNSTWDYTDKKSFNVTYSKAVEIAGVKAEKFSFLANFKDPSLSRNKILYELADKMGVSYSPDTATVDLYMNGLYMGSYLACQKVDIGADNLINDVAEVDLTTNPASFDFVVEIDTKPAADDYAIKLAENRYLTMKSPELPSADFDHSAADTFIRGRYEALSNALNGTDKTALENIVDIDSLAKFYLLNELAKNYDIGVASTYFVYKASTGKFYASPVWDLDMAASNGKKTTDAVDINFRYYEGNWTNSNNSLNELMKAAFNNVNVQAVARSIWTRDYYTELTGYLNELKNKAHNVNVSLKNNNIKWTQPYGFEGEFHDNLYQDDNTKLTTATYDVNTGKYTKNAESTYGYDASGQIDFVVDWLKSRAAWMTQKYNTYYVTGNFNDWNWNETGSVMSNTQNGVNTLEIELTQGTYEFKISSDGAADAYRSASAYSISFSPDMLTNNYTSASTDKITDLSINTDLYNGKPQNNFKFTTTEAMKVYITYDQKANTVTLSDQLSTTTNLAVTLDGTEVANDEIVEGTPVTLTATVTPVMKDNAVLAGTYTVEFLRDGTKLDTQRVIFGTSDLNKTVQFSTNLAGTSQTYTVNVSYTDDVLTTYTDTASKTYKRSGLKDKKIYFDPSTIYVNNEQVWKSQMTPESTVTAYIKNNAGTQVATFTMVVDTEDIHGYDKGVFVANIDEETLALLQEPTNTVVFVMVGKNSTTYATDNDAGCNKITINGDKRIQSGWIYNYSNEKNETTGKEQWKWEEYNVAYEVGYPRPDITTYDEFKDYLADQANEESPNYNKDNIVYFDNSASKWYNVYIYGWADPINDEYGHLMKKLPYGDIWYYDFGETKPTSSFLFKDRGDYGFGSDYQQTVDLVDGTIKNGNNEDVSLSFATSIDKANPIFITNTFYKSSQQGGNGALKFRAFNTEWKEFATVVASEVQLKAVDIYFDLHTKDATDIELYRKATCDEKVYKFPSEFVRLTQLPDSTIYYTKVMLPYSKAKGCEFKFTKFVVNIDGKRKECTMGTASQPTVTCINTGEVWYEVNANYNNVTPQTADYSIVSNKSAVDTSSSVGAYSSAAPVAAANTITVYFAPENSSNTWENSSKDFTNRTYKCNVQGGQKDGGTSDTTGWWTVDMDDTQKTIDGKKVYSATITYNDTGLYSMQFQKLYNGNFENQVVAFKQSWHTTDTISGKYWNGSQFVDPTPLWDSEAESSYYVVGDDNFCTLAGIKGTFAKNDATLMDGSGTTYTKSFTNSTTGPLNVGVKVIEFNGVKDTFHPDGYNTEIKIDVPAGATLTVTFDSVAKTFNSDNLSVSQTSHTITNNAVGVNVSTPAYAGTLVTITPSDSSKKITAVTLSVDAEITYNADGTATFTMPDSDVTINSVTLEDKVVTPSVEYCAVLSYNHSTATFTSEEGGTITDAYVNLIHGNYQDAEIRTGYRTSDNGIYTVIYALPSSTANGPTTSNVSVVEDNNASDKLKFAGWTRDGQAFGQDQLKMEDPVIGASATNYLANFSERTQTTYTFKYNYQAYDSKTFGMEYTEETKLLDKTYSVQVMFYSDATDADDAELLALYKANQPTLVSDYFTYTFDNVNVDTLNKDGTTVSATAEHTVRKYMVFCESADGSNSSFNEYYYQNIATVTIPDGVKPEGYKTVWKDENDKVLYIGDSYRIRVTKNGVTLKYSFEPDASIPLSTYVNEPTYEFFTTDQNVEKVRFNILVDNFIGNKNVTEYGVVYFFTDKDGKPVNESVAHDANITADMIKELMTAQNSPVKTYKFPMELVNSDKKYIFASTLTNNAANKDRYLRVFSYFKYNENGKEVIVVSNESVLASISKAK